MSCRLNVEGVAYGEFPRSPETLNDPEVVETHGGEENFCGVCKAGLNPGQTSFDSGVAEICSGSTPDMGLFTCHTSSLHACLYRQR